MLSKTTPVVGLVVYLNPCRERAASVGAKGADVGDDVHGVLLVGDHAHDDGAHLLAKDVARIGAADAGPEVLELAHEVVAVLLD